MLAFFSTGRRTGNVGGDGIGVEWGGDGGLNLGG